MIKAVIFDMDGVLMDSEHHYLDFLVKFYTEEGLSVKEEDLHILVGCDLDTQYEIMSQFYEEDVKASEIKQRYEKWASLQPPFKVKDWLFDHTLETLKLLQDKGIRMSVGSNAGKEHLERVISECEIGSFFEHTDSAEIHPAGKPDPTIYKHIMEKMELEPHECIIIEDSYSGITAAKGAGALVLGIKDTKYNVDQSLADHLIQSTKDVVNFI